MCVESKKKENTKEIKIKQKIWDYLIKNEIATESELELVTDVAGYSDDVMETVIYAKTGFNDLEQLKEEMGNE